MSILDTFIFFPYDPSPPHQTLLEFFLSLQVFKNFLDDSEAYLYGIWRSDKF